MADTKVSALTAVTTPALTDEFPVNQGGTSKKVTLDQIISLAKMIGGYNRLTLAGAGRFVLGGTTRCVITDYGEGTILRGVPREEPNKSWTVPSGWVHTIEDRMILSLTARATIQGDADLRIRNDIAPRNRIVLAGRGGSV
jgi:hypothetical protein